MENVLVSAEHFSLYKILNQLVKSRKMTSVEMDEILKRSGLKKIKRGEYRDEEGSILVMNGE